MCVLVFVSESVASPLGCVHCCTDRNATTPIGSPKHLRLPSDQPVSLMRMKTLNEGFPEAKVTFKYCVFQLFNLMLNQDSLILNNYHLVSYLCCLL